MENKKISIEELKQLTHEEVVELTKALTAKHEAEGYYSSRFLELSDEEVKAVLTGYFLFNVSEEKLCEMFDLGHMHLTRILHKEIDLFDDVYEKFFKDMESTFMFNDIEINNK